MTRLNGTDYDSGPECEKAKERLRSLINSLSKIIFNTVQSDSKFVRVYRLLVILLIGRPDVTRFL